MTKRNLERAQGWLADVVEVANALDLYDENDGARYLDAHRRRAKIRVALTWEQLGALERIFA